MNKNVGNVDRAVRVVAGVAIIAAGLYFKSWWGVVGAVPLLTGIVRWCPVYLPFGLSTCRTRT
jgi:sulfite exporter TauE/SafE